MNLLGVLTGIERFLCKFVGFYSPWLISSKCSVIYRIISVVIYIMPLAAMTIFPSQNRLYSGQVSCILANMIVLLILLEIYITVYKYNNVKKNVCDIKGMLFGKEDFLKNSSKTDNSGRIEITCFYQFLLLLMKCIMIMILVVRCIWRPMLATFFGTVRAILSSTLLCQWSLCMYHLECRAWKLQEAVKTILEPVKTKVFPLIKEIGNRNSKQEKHLNLKKFDTFIKEYRLLADHHRDINDYYGIHFMFYVSVSVYALLLLWYRSWFCARKLNKCFEDDQYYFVIHALTELACITLTALISESTRQKVCDVEIY